MKSLLKSTYNMRAILPGSLRFLRSDVPNCLTKQEIQWLIANNITTIIDLRTDEERANKVCQLAYNDHFDYICLPVSGGNTLPESVDAVSKSYIGMVDDQMRRIIDRILNAESNVLYFCNAGKDRTGVVSAILLYKAGIKREYIIAYYMKSKECLLDMLISYAEQHADGSLDIITPHERYMEEFLDWLNAHADLV